MSSDNNSNTASNSTTGANDTNPNGSSTGFSPTMTTTEGPPSSDLSALLMHAAYERQKPIAELIALEDTRDMQLDVGDVIETMLVSEPQMQKYRPDLMKLGDFDMSNLDNVKDCTYALAFMYTRVRGASDRANPASVASLIFNRQLLHRHGVALAMSGFFEEERLDDLVKGKSHQDLAYDVVGLTNLFLDKGHALDGQSPITRQKLIEMQTAATAMLTVIGEKDNRKTERAELSPLYRQVFTLAVNTYNEVRDALTYALRKRPDAEELLKTIAPSVYGDRGRRPKTTKSTKSGEADAKDEAHDSDDVPAVAVATTPAVVTDTATSTTRTTAAGATVTGAAATNATAPRDTATRTAAVRAGFPGSSPMLEGDAEE